MMQVHINDSVEWLAHMTPGSLVVYVYTVRCVLNILAEKRVTLLLIASRD